MGGRSRLAAQATDPWLALVAALGGGLAWAVRIPEPVAVLIGVAMWVVGLLVGVLRGREDDGSLPEPKEPRIELVRGTEQAGLVETLTAYVADLRRLRESPLPTGVVDPAIAALVAAEGAQRTARRVAAAVDGLDTALARSSRGPHVSSAAGVRDAVTRMQDRRASLLARLHGTVDGVAEVYTKLLETSATVSALDVGDGALTEIDSVNTSLDSLRTSLAELEADPLR